MEKKAHLAESIWKHVWLWSAFNRFTVRLTDSAGRSTPSIEWEERHLPLGSISLVNAFAAEWSRIEKQRWSVSICWIFVSLSMSTPISLSTIQANSLTVLCKVCSDALVLVDEITLEWFRLTNLIGHLFCSANRPTIRRITDSVKMVSVHFWLISCFFFFLAESLRKSATFTSSNYNQPLPISRSFEWDLYWKCVRFDCLTAQFTIDHRCWSDWIGSEPRRWFRNQIFTIPIRSDHRSVLSNPHSHSIPTAIDWNGHIDLQRKDQSKSPCYFPSVMSRVNSPCR